MQLPYAPTIQSTQPSTDNARLHGQWLVLARLAWAIVAILSICFFVASIPVELARLQTVCAASQCEFRQLDPNGIQALQSRGLSLNFYARYTVFFDIMVRLISIAVGVLIFWRKSEERMALFVALMFVTTYVGPETLAHMHPVWAFPGALLNFVGSISIIFFFYLFPDGRFVPQWTRPLMIIWIMVGVTLHFFPESPLSLRHYPLLGALIWIGILATGMGVQIYRYRRVSSVSQCQQTKWVVYGFILILFLMLPFALVGTIFPSFAPPGSVGQLIEIALGSVAELLLPLAIGIAVLRYRLWDVDPIINRTLVYGALTLSVVGIYVLIVGYLGALFHTGGNLAISLVAAGVVAVLFQPLRERIQRGINRIMYGERDEPYTVISRLGQRLEATLVPDAVLPTIVETVAQALKLPYAAITLKQDDAFVTVAEHGQPQTSSVPSDRVQLPLVYQNEMVGQLILEPRSTGDRFNAADRQLLDDLARQAGVAAHAVRLTADLQHSRERLVTAREEERRRLRRDLHDGLGPQLASQTLTIDAVCKLLERDPRAAATLLQDLKVQSQDAITDIRRLVYNLRPPALDDLGLIGALREQASQYGHTGLHITIDAPERLPPLPAAVEVAAYRIAQEALTNVVRHAEARICIIRLSLDDAALYLEIQDDGRGLPEDHHAGVGLHSMRERAEELGGTCLIEAMPTRGTRIRARLPLS
jgi:signal transduction histidine kinase